MKNKKISASVIWAISLGVFVLAADLISKYVIELYMPLGSIEPFLPGFINLVIVHNDGAAWNSFAGKQVLLIIFTFLIITLFLTYYVLRVLRAKTPISKTFGAAVGLIAGGCFGNLYDRLVFGYVRDFLNFEFMNFPVFNIADAALSVGIVVLIIYFVFLYAKEQKREEQAKAAAVSKAGENGAGAPDAGIASSGNITDVTEAIDQTVVDVSIVDRQGKNPDEQDTAKVRITNPKQTEGDQEKLSMKNSQLKNAITNLSKKNGQVGKAGFKFVAQQKYKRSSSGSKKTDTGHNLPKGGA